MPCRLHTYLHIYWNSQLYLFPLLLLHICMLGLCPLLVCFHWNYFPPFQFFFVSWVYIALYSPRITRYTMFFSFSERHFFILSLFLSFLLFSSYTFLVISSASFNVPFCLRYRYLLLISSGFIWSQPDHASTLFIFHFHFALSIIHNFKKKKSIIHAWCGFIVWDIPIFIIGNRYQVVEYGKEINQWFSKAISRPCILVRCHSIKYQHYLKKGILGSACRDENTKLNFVNEAQLLLISSDSIGDLNCRLSSSMLFINHLVQLSMAWRT